MRQEAIARCVAATLFLASAPSAAADPQACFDAALRGQKLERDGKLLSARDAFTSCAQATCPEEVAKQCTAWLVDVNDAVPTILLAAHDASGRELTDASAAIDGGPPHTAGAESRGVPLDPGSHTLRWRRSTGATLETTIVLREHEKGRIVMATFPAPPKPAPLGAYVLTGTSIVAVAVFGFFAIKGYSDRRSFGCDTECTPSQGSQVRREFIAADVALGVSAVSLAGALWLFLAARHDGDHTRETAFTGTIRF